MEFKSNIFVSIASTSRQGTLNIDYWTLKSVFGEPQEVYGTKDEHWPIKFEDGTIANIYDYYAIEEGRGVKNTVSWGVGGYGYTALNHVVQTLESAGLKNGKEFTFNNN
jgi:hypothetical protein